MSQPTDVRARRAYFDCRFGQLHVRTAFPGTGGFDEFTTLICVHPAQESSRLFAGFLTQIAKDRSVYAPDRPGCGESDPAPAPASVADHAHACADLAADLRLRKIDLLAFQDGCEVAIELAAAKPELVRKVILISGQSYERSASVRQSSLFIRTEAGDGASGFSHDVFEAAPQRIAKAASQFLNQP